MYQQLPDQTRVWIYQSNQAFSEETAPVIEKRLQEFAAQWVSHNNQLKAFGKLYHRQFIVLMVDESQAGASGCSIDKSVHFIKAIEQDFQVDLFDRMVFTYKEGDEVKTAHREAFAGLYKAGKINDNTIVFNNLVNTKKDFEEKWTVPLAQSWHKRMV